MFDEKGEPSDGDAAKAVKSALASYDNVTWAVSPVTGEVVYNHLDEADLNHYKPSDVEYMTRADWNSFPKTYDSISVWQILSRKNMLAPP